MLGLILGQQLSDGLILRRSSRYNCVIPNPVVEFISLYQSYDFCLIHVQYEFFISSFQNRRNTKHDCPWFYFWLRYNGCQRKLIGSLKAWPMTIKKSSQPGLRTSWFGLKTSRPESLRIGPFFGLAGWPSGLVGIISLVFIGPVISNTVNFFGAPVIGNCRIEMRSELEKSSN